MQIKQMEEEKERLNDKVQKAAAQAAGERCTRGVWFKLGVTLTELLQQPCQATTPNPCQHALVQLKALRWLLQVITCTNEQPLFTLASIMCVGPRNAVPCTALALVLQCCRMLAITGMCVWLCGRSMTGRWLSASSSW